MRTGPFVRSGPHARFSGAAVREWRKGNAGLTVRVLPFESRGHGASGAGAPTEPLRVVRVQDGALAMLSYRTTFITFARRTLQWQQPLAGVYGEDDHVFLRDYWIGSVLVHLPDDPDQDAKVLGGGFGRTMPP